jgi:cyclic lactone autoinducer peptide
MKKIVVRLIIFAATTLLLLANVFAASACGVSQYQPEVPDSLRR